MYCIVSGRTPLMLACQGDCPEALTIVQYLLDRNAKVSLSDADGYTGKYCNTCSMKNMLTNMVYWIGDFTW